MADRGPSILLRRRDKGGRDGTESVHVIDIGAFHSARAKMYLENSGANQFSCLCFAAAEEKRPSWSSPPRAERDDFVETVCTGYRREDCSAMPGCHF